jgi:hypothetical protein
MRAIRPQIEKGRYPFADGLRCSGIHGELHVADLAFPSAPGDVSGLKRSRGSPAPAQVLRACTQPHDDSKAGIKRVLQAASGASIAILRMQTGKPATSPRRFMASSKSRRSVARAVGGRSPRSPTVRRAATTAHHERRGADLHGRKVAFSSANPAEDST